MRVLPLLGLASVILTVSVPPARADSDLRAFSVSAGYAGFDHGTSQAHGGVVGISHARRLSDKVPFSWRVAATGGAHYASTTEDLLVSGTATLGASWLLSDTVKYVPYVLLNAGATVVGGKDINTDVVPRIEFGLGMDLLKSREFSYGLQIRAELASPFSVSQTNMLVIAGRATWRWGFF